MGSATADVLESQTYVSRVCVGLLLQELVPTSVRVLLRLSEMKSVEKSPSGEAQTRIDTPLSSIVGDMPGTTAVFGSELLDSEDVVLRVEKYGFDLGLRLTEVLMYKAETKQKIVDILEVMKFICRDAWRTLYGKQMDNLRTNHRGTFVLIDNQYKVTAGFSSEKGKSDAVAKARAYTYLPCGIIRGILLSFGVDAYVSADIAQFPSVAFNIQTTINN
ncbi:transport protein particle component [Metschnikowia bicuspidata var. bicuspidata NRRL YB-4993]|uniref:Transport protein particle component n=1 Tax=Metschnikowia bicuspidata var. bicuspidata NRRL YB-4993 TaxID=869754 RepID=A0A1A0HJA1_9ASCO|nr:transport protein particle component [Metschnikowia bicuspidata var. bicuspidata NRRL YB-4993]OBA24076.1 transport protein particle component [Metschnikowia bicuspidata var. bicuspidata NRRL YB-4993]